MSTTYWQNQHPQALILPTKEGTSITVPQAGYVKDESGTYYTTSFGLTSVSNPGSVVYAYTYTHQVPPPDEVGEPGGTTGQLQYNNAGEFGAVAGSTVDESRTNIYKTDADGFTQIVEVYAEGDGNSHALLASSNVDDTVSAKVAVSQDSVEITSTDTAQSTEASISMEGGHINLSASNVSDQRIRVRVLAPDMAGDPRAEILLTEVGVVAAAYDESYNTTSGIEIGNTITLTSPSIVVMDSSGYALQQAPAGATAPGIQGEVRICSDAIYFCPAPDTWVKAVFVPVTP